MQVNVTNTNAIIEELQNQRNHALTRCATMAGEKAELAGALQAAQARIKELEEAAKDRELKAANDQERDAA
jgi:hypothetical protein